MDVESGDLNFTGHSGNKRFSHDDDNRTRASESTAQFDPKLSSREMRKIKYYEDMFAKMANDNKNLSSDTSNTQYHAPSLQKPRNKLNERRRNSDNKTDDSSGNLLGYRNDSMNSVYTTGHPKSSRRSIYKKPLSSMDLDYSGSKYLNDSTSDPQYTDGKTLLDNKRLIRVQSMPMVTKKKSNVSHSDEKKHDQPRPSSSRKPRVSRWDVRSSFSTPTTDHSPRTEHVMRVRSSHVENVEEQPSRDDASDGFVEDMVIDSKEDEQLAGDLSEEQSDRYKQEQANTLSEADPLDTFLDNDARDLPLDVDDFLNEDLKDSTYDYENIKDEYKQEPGENDDDYKDELDDQFKQEYLDEVLDSLPGEFEPKFEEADVFEQPIQISAKKKSNRGRKAKKKPILLPVEPVVEQPAPVLEEDFTPMSIHHEFVEELKQPPRRTKSQRARKKRHDYYEEKVFHKPKAAAKLTKAAARNHTGSSEKAEKAHLPNNKREFVDAPEEKFISIDNLRMITVEEAEKMLNICTKQNTEYEEAKKFIDRVMAGKYDPKFRDQERNPFLLDPSNIVAPPVAHTQEQPQEPVPENPLEISFKYRLFQNLGKV